MRTKLKAREVGGTNACYVEVDGPDGVKHHVGPFENPTRAEDWIAQDFRLRHKNAYGSPDTKSALRPA